VPLGTPHRLPENVPSVPITRLPKGRDGFDPHRHFRDGRNSTGKLAQRETSKTAPLQIKGCGTQSYLCASVSVNVLLLGFDSRMMDLTESIRHPPGQASRLTPICGRFAKHSRLGRITQDGQMVRVHIRPPSYSVLRARRQSQS
jgi:hypothetical protein